MTRVLKRIFSKPLVLVICIFAFNNLAIADPPTQAARLSYIDGVVTFSPAGDTEWAYAVLNRPMTTGDQLWADAGAKAEIQLGAAAIRIGENTSLTIANFDNQTAQFQLAQGTLNLHLSNEAHDKLYEIDTPNLAFTVDQPGNFRIDVDTANNTTTISLYNGNGQVYGENADLRMDVQQSCIFTRTDLNNPQCSPLPAADDFDRWVSERNQYLAKAATNHYFSPTMVGGKDLGATGSWTQITDYGYAWTPSDVASDWAPYRDGEWVWVEPWGWTWIDHAAWGYAPYHYGRWVYYEGRWYWVPGPANVTPVYAPALVVFIGNVTNWISTQYGEGIGWFPLAPGEVYWPPYSVGQTYFTNINTYNTYINKTIINNAYNNPNMQMNYRNKFAPNAVTAVPKSTFIESRSVSQTLTPISKEVLEKAPISHTATIVPVRESLIGTAKPASIKPPARIFTRPVVVKTAPPPAAVPFSIRATKLQQQPGKPLEQGALKALQPTAPAIIYPPSKTHPVPMAPSNQQGNVKHIIAPVEGQSPATVPQPPAAENPEAKAPMETAQPMPMPKPKKIPEFETAPVALPAMPQPKVVPPPVSYHPEKPTPVPQIPLGPPENKSSPEFIVAPKTQNVETVSPQKTIPPAKVIEHQHLKKQESDANKIVDTTLPEEQKTEVVQ